MRSSQKKQRNSKKLALGEAVKTTVLKGPEEGMVLLESRKGLVENWPHSRSSSFRGKLN